MVLSWLFVPVEDHWLVEALVSILFWCQENPELVLSAAIALAVIAQARVAVLIWRLEKQRSTPKMFLQLVRREDVPVLKVMSITHAGVYVRDITFVGVKPRLSRQSQTWTDREALVVLPFGTEKRDYSRSWQRILRETVGGWKADETEITIGVKCSFRAEGRGWQESQLFPFVVKLQGDRPIYIYPAAES